MKKGLILREDVDVNSDGSTAGDQRYFRLLANRFKRANADWDIQIETYDKRDSTEFLSDISKYSGLDLFAYVGHGGRDALYSAGIYGGAETTSLSDKIRAACNNGASIIFYACNAGRLNDSILRDIGVACPAKNFRLYGHSTAGRAGNNPNKTVFPPNGGAMLIDECLGKLADAPKFKRAWNASFGDEANTLWARFFRMTNTEIAKASCASVLRRGAAANERYKARLGWGEKLPELFDILLPVWGSAAGLVAGIVAMPGGASATRARVYEQALASPEAQAEFVLAVARWQYDNTTNKNGVDGIIGPNTWRAMQAVLPDLAPAQ